MTTLAIRLHAAEVQLANGCAQPVVRAEVLATTPTGGRQVRAQEVAGVRQRVAGAVPGGGGRGP